MNGGFEDDIEAVTKEGNLYSELPTGWDNHHATIMIDYDVRSDYRQDDGGEIFLSILASHNGYVAQNIVACKDLELTLTFKAASFKCDDCQQVSSEVMIDSTAIAIEASVPYEWTSYSYTFLAPGDYFSLILKTVDTSNAQLFIDNVSLKGIYHDSRSPSL